MHCPRGAAGKKGGMAAQFLTAIALGGSAFDLPEASEATTLPVMARFRVPERYWRGGKTPTGIEYYYEPSAFAQDYFFYNLMIGRAKTPPNFRHKHEHEDRCLVHYVRKGEIWHRIRNQTHRARSGQICLVDLREPVVYGNDRTQAADVWWFCFGGKDTTHYLAKLGADQRPLFDLADRRRFERLFGELLDLFRTRPPAFEARVDGTLRLLLAELMAVRSDETDLEIGLVRLSRPVGVLSQPVRDVIRYIARFYADQPLTFKLLCGVSGLSQFHFARVFRRETGISLMKYLDAYRIEKAKRVLATSNHPMVEVAVMVGIPNQFKFSRLFRKLTGVTPTQYRGRARRTKQ